MERNNDITINKSIIGQRLTDLRKSKGLTQAKLSEILDLWDSKSYGKYEQGKSIPPIEKVIILAKLYNVTTDYILLGTSPSTSEKITSLLENCDSEFQEHAYHVIATLIYEFSK